MDDRLIKIANMEHRDIKIARMTFTVPEIVAHHIDVLRAEKEQLRLKLKNADELVEQKDDAYQELIAYCKTLEDKLK